MAQILDDVSYLAQEIGPRPAGTEEEQQAALYIADKLKKDAGFEAEIEDFKCVPDYSIIAIASFGLAFIAALVAFLVGVAAIPAAIVGLVVAVLYTLELVDRPVISRLMANGVSQNVVAKYEPHSVEDVSNRRRRKIVLVARYDSGRSMPLMRSPFLNILPVVQKGSCIALIAVPILLFIRQLAFAHTAGVLSLLFNVLCIVGMAFILLAFAWKLVYRLQQYNDAANSNASGVAVMLEVARRIGAGSASAAPEAEGQVVVHGEEAARKEGLVPEGAELTYEAAENAREQEKSPAEEAEQLAAAKAAIAALTGAPVNDSAPVSDISENLVKVEPEPVKETEELRHEQNLEILNAFAGGKKDAGEQEMQPKTGETSAPAMVQATSSTEGNDAGSPDMAASQSMTVVTESETRNTNISSNTKGNDVPDWYKKAQQRAKRQPQTEPEGAFRSRFAATLDATEERLHEQDLQQEELARQEAARAEEERQRRLIQEQRAQLQRAKEQEAARLKAQQEKDDVSRETSQTEEAQQSNLSMDEQLPDVSRETSGNETVQHASVSRETKEREAESMERGEAQQSVQSVADRSDATMAMSPIDVSDLLAEMKDYKTQEPQVPAFITGEHEKIETSSEKFAVKVVDANDKSDDKEKTRLIDPNAPFVPMPTDRTLKMSVDELSGVSAEEVRKRAEIKLPDLPQPEVAPIAEVTKQRAPLADVTDNKAKDAARSLLSTVLPEVGTVEDNAASHEAAKVQLNNLPSLSGELRAANATESNAAAGEHNTVSATGSFATIGATGSFKAVGDELVADVAPDDLYISDADDSDYEDKFTETGAFAGPGYVEMPKSRFQKLFGKFGFGHKKKREEEMSAHEWLDVDEDFEARAVGQKRGSWESFQEESYDYLQPEYQDTHTGDTGDFNAATAQYDDSYPQGYADGSDYYAEEGYGIDAHNTPLPANSPMRRGNTFANVQLDDYEGYVDGDTDSTKRWNGGAVSSDRVQDSAARQSDSDNAAKANGVSDELEQIYQFRNPGIDMDVWFVALGASVDGNDGINQFIADHEPELKRAIVINLESLGKGELMFVNKEGTLKKRAVSSRMKRCIKKAAQETGVTCGTREIAWRESAATVAMAHKLQGMTLAGMDGLKPAGFAEASDTVESVREDKLQSGVDFVISMLKNI